MDSPQKDDGSAKAFAPRKGLIDGVGMLHPSTRTETVAREKSAIESELINQELSLSQAHDVIARLSDKLLPVRSEGSSPEIGLGMGEPMGSSRFYQHVYQNNHSINQLICRLVALDNELEV